MAAEVYDSFNASNIDRKLRFETLCKYLYQFINSGSDKYTDVLFDQEAIRIVNDFYWHYAINMIRKRMISDDGNIDKHKIIAGTQAVIMTTLPLRRQGNMNKPYQEARVDNDIIHINAVFALSCGFQMLQSWDCPNIVYINNTDKSLTEEHIVWLENVNIGDRFPFFICAHLWYALERIANLLPCEPQ